MKTKILAFAALVCILVAGCNKDDKSAYIPNSSVTSAFETKYPNARAVIWKRKGPFEVAEFQNDNRVTKAWFNVHGQWMMTETDVPSVTDLPRAVQVSLGSSAWAAWKVDDIDQLERTDMGLLYIIEVENGNRAAELHYDASGVLIGSYPDTDNDRDNAYVPVIIPEEIVSFVTAKYPVACIMDFDQEKGVFIIDILDRMIAKEVRLDSSYCWIQTEWVIPYSSLPDDIKMAVSNAYNTYTPDNSADVIDTPMGKRYSVELGKGDSELKLLFDAEGNEL